MSACILTEKSVKQPQYHEDVEDEQTADRNSEDNSEDKVQVIWLLYVKAGIKLAWIHQFQPAIWTLT